MWVHLGIEAHDWLMFQNHNLRGACQCTFAAFQTVGMQITYLLSSAIVWSELHRTDTSAAFALHLAGSCYVYSGIWLGKWLLLGYYPRRYGSHRAERAPSAWRIDERQRDANDGGHDDNRPEYSTDTAPHSQSSLTPWNGESQLDAEH